VSEQDRDGSIPDPHPVTRDRADDRSSATDGVDVQIGSCRKSEGGLR